MAVFAKSVLDYHFAAFAYQCWVEDELLVYAVDINHRCYDVDTHEYYNFMKIVVNQDSLFRPSLPPYSPLPDNPPSYSPTQTGQNSKEF